MRRDGRALQLARKDSIQRGLRSACAQEIESGLSRGAFMARLEEEVESASNTLMREAGFDPQD